MIKLSCLNRITPSLIRNLIQEEDWTGTQFQEKQSKSSHNKTHNIKVFKTGYYAFFLISKTFSSLFFAFYLNFLMMYFRIGVSTI